jgi:hypothetical protein
MKFLKQLLIGLIGLSLVVIAISSFLPSTVRISRGIFIHANPTEVFSTVKDLSTWKDWNPILQDSSVKYSRTGAGELQWQYGNGSTNTVTILQNKGDTIFVNFKLGSGKDFQSGFAFHAFQNDSLKTQADWWIIEKLKWYPWQKFYGIFADRLKGPSLDSGLTRLKQYIETRNN